MTNEEIVKRIKKNLENENTAEYLEKLYINNKGYIYKIASKYSAYAELDDLMQEGFLGLYNAIEPYDETQGTLFMTYAGYHIQQAISRYIENNSKTVRIPVHLLSQTQQYKRVANAFRLRLGREPSKSELCGALGIDFKALKNIECAILQFNQLESLNEPINSLDGDDMLLGDSVSDNSNLENDIIDTMMQNRLKVELWQIVNDNTTEEENNVINARYKHNLTLEVTGQSMGQSRDRVRNIEAKALRKLRRYKITKELQEKFEINYTKAYRSSFSSFNYDWTSSTERVALRNIELEKMI